MMLDADICIGLMRAGVFVGQVPDGAVISSITLAELETGVSKCLSPARERMRLRTLLGHVRVRAFGARQSRCYGSIRARLEREGRRIGTMDMLIAAHAVSLRMPLVSRNHGEFRRVPGLDLA